MFTRRFLIFSTASSITSIAIGCGSSSSQPYSSGDAAPGAITLTFDGGRPHDAALADVSIRGLDAGNDSGRPLVEAATGDAGTEAATAPPELDATVDTGPSHAVDAGVDATSTVDAGSPEVILLEAVNNLGSGRYYEYASIGGEWEWRYQSAFDATSIGGITFLPGGGAVSVSSYEDEQDDLSLGSGVWSGSAWTSAQFFTSFGSSPDDIGIPAATPTGAGVAYTNAGIVYADFSAGSWSSETLPSAAALGMAPVVAVTAAGDPIVLMSTYTTYLWSMRSGGVWTTPVAVPGLPAPTESIGFVANAAAVRAVGTDQIVAVFQTAPPQGGAWATSATFSAGAWSTPVTFTTNVYGENQGNVKNFSLAALPDGRVALGYLSSSLEPQFGFWSGTEWGPFAPSNAAFSSGDTFTIAPGIGGAILELVFGSGNISHERLTDEAAWTWSTPTYIDTGALLYSAAIATSP